MNAVRFFLLALLAVLVLTGAAWAGRAEAAEPLSYSSTSPADGAALTAGQGDTPWVLGAQPGLVEVWVEVATRDQPGQDGTLADDYTSDFFPLFESDAYPGVYRGYSNSAPSWWNAVPGTYFWMIRATCPYFRTSCGGDPGSFTYRQFHSPVMRIHVRAAPATGGGGGAGGFDGPTGPNLRLSLTAAKRYVKAVIKDAIGSPKRFRAKCSRLSAKRMRCRATWRKGRYRYSGKGTFFTFADRATGKRDWDFTSLKGTRKGCKALGGRGGCKRRFSY